jgi:nucleoside-diphosphate-sugar epimerase
MVVLVTGGNGLYGHGTIRALLDQGVEVVSFDISPRAWYMDDLEHRVRFVQGDLMAPTELLSVCRQEGVDRIVHFAAFQRAECQENPWVGSYLNIMGTIMVLDVARILGLERVVCASSGSPAGNVSGKFSETVRREPTCVYGMTKLMVEHLVEQYARTHGVDGLTLRPAIGYGIGPRLWALPFFEMIVSALRGETVTVTDTGQKIEIMYYRDGGRAFAMAALAETPPHRLFNLGIGRVLSRPEIADILREAIPGSRLELVTGSLPPLLDLREPRDITRAREELGWVPEYQPEQGIPEHVAWIREHYLPRFN